MNLFSVPSLSSVIVKDETETSASNWLFSLIEKFSSNELIAKEQSFVDSKSESDFVRLYNVKDTFGISNLNKTASFSGSTDSSAVGARALKTCCATLEDRLF